MATTCPVVMMSGHGTVPRPPWRPPRGWARSISSKKPLSLTGCCAPWNGRSDAEGRRKRLSARAQGQALAVPIGKSKVTQALREQRAERGFQFVSPVLLLGELGSGREVPTPVICTRRARGRQSRFSWWLPRACRR